MNNNLWFCKKCRTTEVGPEWRNNQAGGTITVNPSSNPPICHICGEGMSPTSGMHLADETIEPLDEANYLVEVRASGGTSATRYVHITGHTTYDSDKSHPMRYHASGYKTQTLDLTDHSAHWEG